MSAFGTALAPVTSPTRSISMSWVSAPPLAPMANSVTPDWLRIPVGLLAVPSPPSATRLSSTMAAPTIARRMASGRPGASSLSSRETLTMNGKVLAVNLTWSTVTSEGVMVPDSACQAAVGSPVILGMARVVAPIGTVVAPASMTTVAARSRSMIRADSRSGTR
jgi:hypothetical protein